MSRHFRLFQPEHRESLWTPSPYVQVQTPSNFSWGFSYHSCFSLTYPRTWTAENSKKRHLCERCLIREKIALEQIHQVWMYATAFPAQNQNSSFVCHLPMLLTDKRDFTLTGREITSPFEAGKWPLALTGPWVKHKDNLWAQKGHRCIRTRALWTPFRLPPSEFSALVDAKREGISNPESKMLWWKQTQLHQHLPNTSGPVNHKVAFRSLNGSSEVTAVVKTLQLANPPLVPFGKMAALTAICPFRT